MLSGDGTWAFRSDASPSTGTEQWGSGDHGPAGGVVAGPALGAKGLERLTESMVVDLESSPEVCAPEGVLAAGEFGEDEVFEGDVGGGGGFSCELEVCARAVGPRDEAEREGLGGRVGAVLEREAEGSVATGEVGIGVAPGVEVARPSQGIALGAAAVFARVVDL